MSEFGANFRKAREALGLSLGQIAVETRISTRFLEAIENEEFHLLPGGIFNRGFIRNYADRIGLDAEQAVADYERLSEYREPTEVAMAADAQTSAQARPRRLYPVVIGALVLLIIIFYFATREGGTSTGNEQVPTVLPASTVPIPVPEPSLAPLATPDAPATSPANTIDPSVVKPPLQPPADPPALLETLALEMEILEPTWVKLVTDGTEVVAGVVLQPGMVVRYTAHASIAVTIGNAGGLVLRVNDREVRSLGRSGQVREFNITPDNLKDIFG
jgi:cytoskeletal protein RodZ